MKITRSTALGLCALAIATAPACSTTESDVDTTAATSAESTTATDARVNRVGIDPCTLLTDAEAEDAVGFAPLTPTLGIDPDNPRASCDLRPADTSVEVLIGVAIGEMKYIPDHDASLTVAGVEVKFSPETPDSCMAFARLDEGRGLLLRLVSTEEKRAAAALDPTDSWCTQAAPALEEDHHPTRLKVEKWRCAASELGTIGPSRRIPAGTPRRPVAQVLAFD